MADYWMIFWSLMSKILVWINYNQQIIKQWWPYWNLLVNCKILIRSKKYKLWFRQLCMEELQEWSELEVSHLNRIKDIPEYALILIIRIGLCLYLIELLFKFVKHIVLISTKRLRCTRRYTSLLHIWYSRTCLISTECWNGKINSMVSLVLD